MTVMFERRQLVIPGDLLAEDDYVTGENAYMDGRKIYAQKVGLAEVDGRRVFVVSLKGKYMPKVEDIVVGQVVDVGLNGWTVDINSPYPAFLNVSDVRGKSFGPRFEALSKIIAVGEIVAAKVTAFDRTRDPAISIRDPGLGKVDLGTVVELTPAKVPRLIGKKGSMIGMIKQETGCDVIAGQNGKILVHDRDPEKVELVIRAVRMIEKEAHTSGLTDRVKAFLESSRKVKTVE